MFKSASNLFEFVVIKCSLIRSEVETVFLGVGFYSFGMGLRV